MTFLDQTLRAVEERKLEIDLVLNHLEEMLRRTLWSRGVMIDWDVMLELMVTATVHVAATTRICLLQQAHAVIDQMRERDL
jgi:hypothetical protein